MLAFLLLILTAAGMTKHRVVSQLFHVGKVLVMFYTTDYDIAGSISGQYEPFFVM